MPKTSADQSIVRYTLPRLLTFLITTSAEDPENARTLVAHALTAFTLSLPDDKKGVAMSLFVPALLVRASGDGELVYKETSTRLLELAGANQLAFKGVVSGMPAGQKVLLEEVLRSGGGGNSKRNVDEGDGREPTIALRMDFGGA